MEGTRDVTRATPRLRRLRVLAVAGPDAGAEWELGERRLAIGSATDNEVVLRDPTVSRYHCELRRDPRGVRLDDLGSSNGTYVSGVRVERGVVGAGARFELGHTQLELREGEAREEPAPAAPAIDGVIARSVAMQRVLSDTVQLARSHVSVLLQGETGTGKEVLARVVHKESERAAGPFVVVDCGALPAALVASELFGHERGAFTGADRRRVGAFERANGGTLFLDEIGELPAAVQPALLGALERRRFRRVGGDTPIDVDVRVISATHRDLRPEANAGTFRPDLYFRLAVGRVWIPALRERPEDIDELVEHFARELTGRSDPVFGEAALAALRAHRWTGNVRELRNVVEASIAMGRLALREPREVARAPAAASAPAAPDGDRAPYAEARAAAIERFERAYLGALIEETEGNASEAARRARMDRAWLLKLLKRHGLR